MPFELNEYMTVVTRATRTHFTNRQIAIVMQFIVTTALIRYKVLDYAACCSLGYSNQLGYILVSTGAKA